MGQSPRARARLLARSGKAAPGLFVPLVLAQAAEVEAIALPQFLVDPTKLSRGLTALGDALPVDGLVVTAADGLLAEAAGSELDWSSYPPRVLSHPGHGGRLPADSAERAARHPRVAAAAEAAGRLTATAPGEPVLVAALDGPFTLAAQLGGPWFTEAVAGEGEPAVGPYLEAVGTVALAVTKRFVEAGVNLILLVEESVPPAASMEMWRSMLTPVVNVTRFHQAAPVVVTTDAGGCSSIPISVGACAPPGAELPGPPTRVKGVALPPEPKEWLIAPPAAPLVTTGGAVPATVTFATVLDACRRLPLPT